MELPACPVDCGLTGRPATRRAPGGRGQDASRGRRFQGRSRRGAASVPPLGETRDPAGDCPGPGWGRQVGRGGEGLPALPGDQAQGREPCPRREGAGGSPGACESGGRPAGARPAHARRGATHPGREPRGGGSQSARGDAARRGARARCPHRRGGEASAGPRSAGPSRHPDSGGDRHRDQAALARPGLHADRRGRGCGGLCRDRLGRGRAVQWLRRLAEARRLGPRRAGAAEARRTPGKSWPLPPRSASVSPAAASP